MTHDEMMFLANEMAAAVAYESFRPGGFQKAREELSKAVAEQARRAACFDELVTALTSCRAEIWRLLDVKGVEPKVARDWIEIKAADAALANAKGTCKEASQKL